ncbi:MAG TPA: hypothetical protein VGI10_23135 [Polyangiaceae bacterium]|jgi:hypothetical protein
MNRIALKSGLLAAAIVATPALASAQTFGHAGQLVVSAERLFGFVSNSVKMDDPGQPEQTSHATSFELLGNLATTTYGFARIGIDYFVIDGLTLGGSLAYVHASTSAESGGVSADGPTTSGFLVMPRVGYAAMFNDTVGIWPRGGFTYLSATATSPNNLGSADVTRSAITLEAPLIISPVPHTGFLIGPTLDLGVGGSDKATIVNVAGVSTTTSGDRKATDIGVQAGLFVYF